MGVFKNAGQRCDALYRILVIGGFKPDSGIGREGLGYSIDEVTILKTVLMPGQFPAGWCSG